MKINETLEKVLESLALANSAEDEQERSGHVQAALNRLHAILRRTVPDDDEVPEPIHKRERRRYPCAKKTDDRDSAHRIPGYPNYFASPEGRIWSYKSGKWLKAQTPKNGFALTVQLPLDGFPHTESVAKLVLLTHDVGDLGAPVGTAVGYRDGDPANCKLSNIYWK